MPGEKLRVGIDLNGTVEATEPIKQKIVKKFFGKEIPARLLKRDIVVTALGLLTHEQYDQVLQHLFTWKWFKYVQPRRGALKAIKDIRGAGHDLVIITASGKQAFSTILKWCRKRPVLDPNRFPVYPVGTGNPKEQLTLPLDIDVFLDDRLEHLRALPSVPHRFLMARDYNRGIKRPPGIERVGWNRFTQCVQEIAHARRAEKAA